MYPKVGKPDDTSETLIDLRFVGKCEKIISSVIILWKWANVVNAPVLGYTVYRRIGLHNWHCRICLLWAYFWQVSHFIAFFFLDDEISPLAVDKFNYARETFSIRSHPSFPNSEIQLCSVDILIRLHPFPPNKEKFTYAP